MVELLDWYVSDATRLSTIFLLIALRRYCLVIVYLDLANAKFRLPCDIYCATRGTLVFKLGFYYFTLYF